MNNYKLIIQYDGSGYSGWQIQSNVRTIQNTIVDAIETIIKEKVNLIGSGRTDTGVHALGQVANFRTDQHIDPYKFTYSLNSVLPSDISIVSTEKVDENFHSRFDARKRTYRYLFTEIKSPFFKNYAYHYHEKIDVAEFNSISKLFLGKKNFTSFSKKNDEIINKFCEVYSAKWYEEEFLKIFEISADRFLHGMVRTVTGTILKTLKHKDKEGYIKNIFNSENRESAPMAVPAHGLFLYRVDY